MSLRLLLCSGSLEGGGSERQLWQLASMLDDRFAPQIYLLHRRGVYLERLPPRIPVHDFWSQQQRTQFWPTEIHRRQVKHLTHVLRQQNIELVYDRTFHMTLVTAPACRQAKVPRVSVIVSPPSRDFERSSERFALVKKRMLSRAYRDPQAVTLAVSDEVADDTADYLKVPRERIRVMPSPVDLDAVRRAAQEPFPRKCAFCCCVVGRMTVEKGHSLALRAFAEFLRTRADRDAVLVFAGDGPERVPLQQQAQQLGIGDQVDFLGYLDNPYPLMASADVLLLPSDYEGLPNVVLEAMALQTSIVATPCSQTLKSILHGLNHPRGQAGIMVPSREAYEISAALKYLETNLEARLQMQDNAAAYVSEYHDLHRWYRGMCDLFRSGTAHSGSGE